MAGTAIIQFLGAVVMNGIAVVKPEWSESVNFSLLLSMGAMYLVGFPLLIMMLKKDVPAEKIEKHKMTAGQYVLSAIICLGLAYASNLFGNMLTYVIGYAKGDAVENTIADVASAISPWMILLYMVICAPIMEEYIFRKLIVERTVRYGQGVAVVVSGLMFGLFHGNLNQFVYATVIGMFLAFLYVKTGNIKITISLHMLFNFIGGFLASILAKNLDLDDYMTFAEYGSASGMLEHLRYNLVWWVMYGLFLLFVIGMLISGIVLFIVFAAKKKFSVEDGKVFIPKELRFNIAFANSGMIVFGIFWIIMIILQLQLS